VVPAPKQRDTYIWSRNPQRYCLDGHTTTIVFHAPESADMSLSGLAAATPSSPVTTLTPATSLSSAAIAAARAALATTAAALSSAEGSFESTMLRS
jgi:hypothetical protein